MKNPIKDNRIVVDETFALRLLGFALESECTDACSEDEKESMVSYSVELLRHQIDTATCKDEIGYLERCGANARLLEGLKFLGKKY